MSLGAFDVKLPTTYRSVDFKTFEGLSKIALGVCKEDINQLTLLNSADHCPEHFLPVLCSKIGMPYFSDAIPYVNRQILKLWRWMIKHKGTEEVLRLMSSFALMSFSSKEEDIKSILNYVNSVDVYLRTSKNMANKTPYLNIINNQTSGETSPETGSHTYIHIRPYIEIFYESIPNIEQSLIEERIMKYIAYVRPASWRVRFQPALIQREGGDGHGLLISAGMDNINQSPEQYTIGHSYVRDEADTTRKEYGVDFSEVWDNNNETT